MTGSPRRIQPCNAAPQNTNSSSSTCATISLPRVALTPRTSHALLPAAIPLPASAPSPSADGCPLPLFQVGPILRPYSCGMSWLCGAYAFWVPHSAATVPPRSATPGELGTVMNRRATYEQITATLLDLAARGHLTITPLPPADDTAWWQLEMAAGHDQLRPFEQLLLTETRVRTGPERFPNLTKGSLIGWTQPWSATARLTAGSRVTRSTNDATRYGQPGPPRSLPSPL